MSVFVDWLRREKPEDPQLLELRDAALDVVAVPIVDIGQIYNYVMGPLDEIVRAKQKPSPAQREAQLKHWAEVKAAVRSGAPLRPLFKRMWLRWKEPIVEVGVRAEHTIFWRCLDNVRIEDEIWPRAWVGDVVFVEDGHLYLAPHCLRLQLGENNEFVRAVFFKTEPLTEANIGFAAQVVEAALYHMGWKKETRLIEHTPKRQQRRQAAREGLPQPSTFHVLDITQWIRKVNAAVARDVGPGATGAQRQHVVCGHVKTFTPSGPIGGCKLCLTTGHPDYPEWNKFPHVGTFWVDSFVAGNPDMGAVDKEYRALPHTDEQEDIAA